MAVFQLRNQLVFDSGHQVVFLISMVRDFPYQNQSKISMVGKLRLSTFRLLMDRVAQRC